MNFEYTDVREVLEFPTVWGNMSYLKLPVTSSFPAMILY